MCDFREIKACITTIRKVLIYICSYKIFYHYIMSTGIQNSGVLWYLKQKQNVTSVTWAPLTVEIQEK